MAGLNTLTLLDMGRAGRTAGLGFDYLSLFGNDISVAIDNPSMITPEMNGTLVASLQTMSGLSTVGSISYGLNVGSLGTAVVGFHYCNYGSFEEYSEEEQHLGKFSVADYALNIGWGMWIDSNFSIGANFKPVLSQYEQYTAVALALDVCGSFVTDNRRFSATLMARNMGSQIVTFDQTVEKLPFELSAALSYKLARAPFRLFFAATELQHWNLRYDDPLNPTTQTDPFTGQVTTEKWYEGVFDNLMRHTLFGIEVNIGKSVYGRVGYNYRQAAEMKGADAFNLSGFSFGFGIRTKRFDFAFARRNFHLSQAPNFFTFAYRF